MTKLSTFIQALILYDEGTERTFSCGWGNINNLELSGLNHSYIGL